MAVSRSFITTDTVYDALNNASKVLVKPGDIITPDAKDLARRKNVRFVYLAAGGSRVPLIAANWKMNTPADIPDYLKKISEYLKKFEGGDVVIFPPALYLPEVAAKAADGKFGCGLQNISSEAKGAFTGEISCELMLKFNAKYVIIGHSERRSIFGESDSFINKKVKKALSAGCIPLLCIGEDLVTNKAGGTLEFVAKQISEGFAGIPAEQAAAVVIAYEPIWAIGTGVTPSVKEIQFTHAAIREVMKHLYGDIAGQVKILYGGSVNDANAKEILCLADVDGALVGGASLEAEKFKKIIEALV